MPEIDNLLGSTRRVVEEQEPLNNCRGVTYRVLNVGGGGSVDYTKVVSKTGSMPVASADNADIIYLYDGETDANYTHGYIYENVATTTSSSASATQTVGSGLSDIVVDLETLESFTGWTTDNSLQIFYTPDGWSVDTASLGVSYTGTPVEGDAITIVYTAPVTTYAWQRINVQPGDGDETRIIIKDDTIPTASADNIGQMYIYAGETSTTYTHGYIYECIATPVYDATVQFNPATLSSTTAACSGSDFAALVARWGTGAIDTIIKGTLTYDESGELLVFVGQDDTDTTVCTFQLYVQDYADAGFTFTGTFQDGDVITFTCTIEETGATYAWVRIDTQPQPAKELPTQAGNTGKYLTTNGVSVSWAAVESLPDQTGQSGKFLTTDGTDASWANVESLPSQSGQSGKFLTTDGSAASWGAISALQNTATGNNSLTILGTAATGNGAINIGAGSRAAAWNLAIGFNAQTNSGVQTCCYGYGSGASHTQSVSLGAFAQALADHAIQIGSTGFATNNSDANTFKVANANGNFEMMNANGNLPADRLASTTGLADGNYKLRLTISSGVATLSWVAE